MRDFKEAVLTHLKAKEVNGLKKILNEANELEIINIMDEFTNEELVMAYRLLNKDLALEVFEGLDLNDQQNLISSLAEKEAGAVFAELAPDDRVRLLDELPASVAKRMLASLNREDREDVNLLMGFAPETAGRLMTPEYVRLRKEWTVGEALDRLKTIAKEKETIYTLYVTDEKRKLEGVTSLRDLFITAPDVLVSEIMDSDVVSFHTGTDQEEVAKSLQILDLLAVPIVDKEDRLVGIITVDDAMDILQDEATEDIFAHAGISGRESAKSEVLIDGKLAKICRLRLPVLIIALVGGMVAAGVMEQFEDVLEAVAATAFFIPVIMDMGGSLGTQSATIFARGLVLGHIKEKSIAKHILKETSVGLLIGAISGICVGIAAYIWLGMLNLAMALALSMTITMTLSAFLGFIVPFFLIKFKGDHATGSGPIITSIKDISGLFIYFGLVMLFLGYIEPEYKMLEAIVYQDGIVYHVDFEEEIATVINMTDCEVDFASCGVDIPDEIEVTAEYFEVRLPDGE